MWSLKAYKHYDEINSKSKNEVRHYKNQKCENSIKLPEYYSYPVEIQAIFMWEEINDLKINVFVLDESNNIKIEYHSSYKTKNVCNLLLYKEHYVWIKNLDRFDASNTSNHSIVWCCDIT